MPGYADFFVVGSGVPIRQNGTTLWSGAYLLNVRSQFGNTIGSGYHLTFSQVNFSVQKYVYITPNQREVFSQWTGTGPGSYTGPSNLASVNVHGNITETAVWNAQYYINASSQFGNVSGSGWYAPNTTASITLSSSIVNISQGTREAFQGWSNGDKNLQVALPVLAPTSISASWQKQYFLYLNTSLGTASGSGWYNANSTARVSLSSNYFNSTNTTRIAFYSWSGVYNQSSVNITVDSPLVLNAIFKRQHLVDFAAKDSEYSPINVSYFVVNGQQTPSSIMLFDGVPYKVTGAFYKGVLLPVFADRERVLQRQHCGQPPCIRCAGERAQRFQDAADASVFLTLKNGTSSQIYLGQSGSVVLQDVPLGYVTGYAKYSIMQEKFSASDGSNINMLFITPSVALPIIILVLVMVTYELLHRRVFSKRFGGETK